MKVFVAGHRGMVGGAIVRRLAQSGDAIVTRTRTELDLLNQQAVADFLAAERPDMVIVAAAKVGGIWANNQYPADFIYENLMIEANLIHQSYSNGINRLMFLGSSCIYPRMAPQPIPESALLNGALEPTNEPYAMAKLAGIKLCESYNRQYGTDYRSIMPTNLYGPGDNFHETNSHVLPALIHRFHKAKQDKQAVVEIWGTGKPRREFLHVDDMADATLFAMNLPLEKYQSVTTPMESHLNIGVGDDIAIGELALLIADIIGFAGEISFDTSKPDGTPRKLLDVSKMKALGWEAKIPFRAGIEATYRWYLDNHQTIRTGQA